MSTPCFWQILVSQKRCKKTHLRLIKLQLLPLRERAYLWRQKSWATNIIPIRMMSGRSGAFCLSFGKPPNHPQSIKKTTSNQKMFLLLDWNLIWKTFLAQMQVNNRIAQYGWVSTLYTHVTFFLLFLSMATKLYDACKLCCVMVSKHSKNFTFSAEDGVATWYPPVAIGLSTVCLPGYLFRWFLSVKGVSMHLF